MEDLRASRPDERPALAELWQAAFGDSPEEIGRFFDTYRHPERTLVLAADGKARAMLTWFDMPIVTAGGVRVTAAYLYAVATQEAYRGRGFAGRLLDYAARSLARLGFCAVTTVPSDGPLHGFYAARGFAEQFALAQWEHTPGGRGGGLALAPVDGSEYGRLREARLAGRAHVACGGEALALADALCRASGGGLFRVGADGCACAEMRDGALFIKELLCPAETLDAAADALLALRPAERCIVRAPAAPGRAEIPFGMTRWLAPPPPGGQEPGYPGLAFD